MSVVRVALVELKRLTSGVLPVLVLFAMSCIPLLYGSLYLYGNWDAYGNVNGIVGALVVEDEGAKDASGNDLNTGADVKKSLLDAGTFDWKSVETRDKAVQGVSDGTYDFALVIPKDFSARLVSTGSFKPDEKGNTGPINPQAAGLEIITNDANNYVLTNIVTKAGTAVRDSVASKVGDKTANTLLASFTTIHGKMNEAADGADKINANTVKLSDAMTQSLTEPEPSTMVPSSSRTGLSSWWMVPAGSSKGKISSPTVRPSWLTAQAPSTRVPEKSMTVPSSSLTDHQPWPTVPLTRITALPSWRMAPQPSQTAPAALRKARTTSPKVPSRSPTERIRSRMHWIRTGCVNFPERSPPCAKT